MPILTKEQRVQQGKVKILLQKKEPMPKEDLDQENVAKTITVIALKRRTEIT
jgi:hypothetical protein